MFVTPALLCFNPLIQIFGSPAILLPPSKMFSTRDISSNTTLDPLHTHPKSFAHPKSPAHTHTHHPSLAPNLARLPPPPRYLHRQPLPVCRAVYPPIYIPSPP